MLVHIARGTALYFGIHVFVRLMPRRTGGELARIDLISALLVAEAAAHDLGGYESVSDGIIMIATLMGWNFFINVLSHHVPLIERLISSPPLKIIENGELLRRNMREYLTEEELMSHLREGIDRVEDVKAACVEGKGNITVISNSGG